MNKNNNEGYSICKVLQSRPHRAHATLLPLLIGAQLTLAALVALLTVKLAASAWVISGRQRQSQLRLRA
jgi:hypothetical protein